MIKRILLLGAVSSVGASAAVINADGNGFENSLGAELSRRTIDSSGTPVTVPDVNDPFFQVAGDQRWAISDKPNHNGSSVREATIATIVVELAVVLPT